jgi:peptide-methionine (S)-S-oxide reductase
MEKKLETTTLGAGCFWCIEAIYQDVKGVHSVVSGYMGGHVKNPTYEQVCNGDTGHAEVAQIKFDPGVISFEDLLYIFWQTHDPTTLNRQGGDIGTQYRSAIFYHNDEQKQIAEKSKAEASKLFSNPIVTEITPASEFYKAENYHQNFYKLNPNQPYCRAVIDPKVRKFRKSFSDRLQAA